MSDTTTIIDVHGWSKLTADQTPEGEEKWRGVRVKKSNENYDVAAEYAALRAEAQGAPVHPPLVRVRSFKSGKVFGVRLCQLVEENDYGDLLFDTEFADDNELPEGFVENAPPPPGKGNASGGPSEPTYYNAVAGEAEVKALAARLDKAADVMGQALARIDKLEQQVAALTKGGA